VVGMGASTGPADIWPADVIHVNEDGWVLINRGGRHGIPVGLRLLAVGQGTRELADLFAPGAQPARAAEGIAEDGVAEDGAGEAAADGAAGDEAVSPPAPLPVALRIRRTYELLEVVYVEEGCAVAISARTPAERRPQFYRAPEGELLVWVPLPPGFTYPKPGADEDEEPAEDDGTYAEPDDEGEDAAAAPGTDTPGTDTPPQRAEQEDERWEEALPLNGVGVGDSVVPAVPAQPRGASASAGGGSRQAPGAGTDGTTFEQGRTYDWMKTE